MTGSQRRKNIPHREPMPPGPGTFGERAAAGIAGQFVDAGKMAFG
jgi:hypothetical protein